MQKIKLNIEIGVKENKEAIKEEVTELLLAKYFKETNYTGLTYIKIEEKRTMVRMILEFISDLFSNWYIILGLAAVAFIAAVLDNFIITEWLYPLGLYASYVLVVCCVYTVGRVLIEALYSPVKELISWIKSKFKK